MKRSHLFTFVLLCAGLLLSFTTRAANFIEAASVDPEAVAQTLYEELDLDAYGLQKEALEHAVTGYGNLMEQGQVANPQYLTIVDYSQSLFNRRFYLLDMAHGALVLNTYAMHGRNSGGEMAEAFSNQLNSNQSSLGFYITGLTYNGSRGYSMRLMGQEAGFNTNALARGVVLHGSVYINQERAESSRVERSLGCPAIPQAEVRDVINRIKGGSVFFVYHPSAHYLQSSALLQRPALDTATTMASMTE